MIRAQWNNPLVNHVCVTVEHFANYIANETGVDLHQLPPFTALLVWTRNSSYHIVVMEGCNICVQGGTSFPEATPAYLDGARIGASLLKVGWIAVGLSMEIRAAGKCVVTSPVRAITTDLPGTPTVH
jgi:hypothetical protein